MSGLFLLSLLLACRSPGDGTDTSAVSRSPDSDGDGVVDVLDCAPDDPTASPAGTEVCDGVDNDCDGDTDELASDAVFCYPDLDADGYGDPAGPAVLRCACAGDESQDATDCDDGERYANPGEVEICGDGLDNDCTDGVDDAGAADAATWYADADGDGYGAETDGVPGCAAPDGTVNDATDCDDGDASIHPGADETCDGLDQNCDGSVDQDPSDGLLLWFWDGDGDGYGDASATTSACADAMPAGYVRAAGDCDDTDDTVNPDGTEVCDGKDNDCDAATSEDDLAGVTWYHDADEDGYGVASRTTTSCADPDIAAGTSEWVLNDQDCDDDDGTTSPSATEICDGVYNDCDARGAGTTAPDDEIDGDGDGYVLCTYKSSTWKGDSDVTGGKDCDDDDVAVYPKADEICDGQYNNCSSRTYDATSAPDDELDPDGDLFVACDGYRADDWVGDPAVIGDNDCGADDNTVYPGADEICDGQYNDCSNADYDADSAPDDELDGDGDGYVVYAACDMSGWVGDGAVVGGDDCDDKDDTIYPDAAEICDGQYNDCSDPSYSTRVAPTDERDVDNDGYVPCEYVNDLWVGDPTVSGGDDCDDADATVYPNATEVCDGQYNDCASRFYSATASPTDEQDGDGDTFVACSGFIADDWVGDASVTGDDDCDDADATVYPSADEICDGQYNDCDDPAYDADSAPDDEQDGDDDGYVVAYCDPSAVDWHGGTAVVSGSDCDDADALVYPGATEICDGQYNDCEDPDYAATGEPVDERDRDRDGYVPCRYVAELWGGDPTVIGGDDCDDTADAVYPGATEVCDGQYNNCDASSYTAGGTPADETDGDDDTFVPCADFNADTWLGDPAITGGDDCDDDDATVYPDADEICDGQYDDCSSRFYDAESAPDDELDDDDDGYVACDLGSLTEWAGATKPTGGGDCDDTSRTVYPGAPERCDGRYDDCDDPGYVFGLQDAPDDELDDDGDDYVECSYSAASWVGDDVTVIGGEDCDDGDEVVFPGAPEVCDGQYNDCDDPAYTDDDAPSDEWDDDGDLFVDCARYASVDWRPFDGVTDAPENDWLTGCLNNRNCTDCDDADPTAFPGAAEAEDDLVCMADADEDGFGDDSAGDPVTAGTDCDDRDDQVYPYADEVCEADEQVDNDCNGDVNTWYNPETGADEAVGADGGVTVYLDADGDGFGDPALPYEVCVEGDGFSLQPTDCDDADATRYPGAVEICNGRDDDCDAEVDESADLDPDVSGCVEMFRDVDRDDYGDYDVSECLCRLDGETAIEDRGDLYVISGGDCDDTNDAIHPLSCRDGIDNDDDGLIDGKPGDAEGDPDCLTGYNETGTEVEVYVETLDGHDDDCDGFVAAAELDCDDDASFPALPTVTTVGSDAAQFGLSTCTDDADGRQDLSCWGEEISVTCDVETGLWVFRYDESDDGWGGRYLGGRRVWTTTSARKANRAAPRRLVSLSGSALQLALAQGFSADPEQPPP